MQRNTNPLTWTLTPTLLAMVSACELQPPVCGGGEPAQVEIIVETQGLTAASATGPLELTGSLVSERYVERLLVGPVEATPSGPNFAEWTATLTSGQLEALRGAGGSAEFAEVPLVAEDACGGRHLGAPLAVRVDAPAGTTAPGLSVEVSLADGEDCYLPVSGSVAARVDLRAPLASAGVRVGLDSAVAGEFVGLDSEGRIRLEADAGAGEARATALFRPTGEGGLGLVAEAGASFAVDGSGLVAVAAPKFSGAAGSIPVGVSALVRAATDGRLERCWAEAAQPGLVSVSGGGSADLLVEDALFDAPQCEQDVIFDVSFDGAAPFGTAVVIRCRDSHGQDSSVELEAGSA